MRLINVIIKFILIYLQFQNSLQPVKQVLFIHVIRHNVMLLCHKNPNQAIFKFILLINIVSTNKTYLNQPCIQIECKNNMTHIK